MFEPEKAFKAIKSLLFNRSNSLSSLGTMPQAAPNLIRHSLSQRSCAWELFKFSPAVDSISLNSKFDKLESGSDSENDNFAGEILAGRGDRSGQMTWLTNDCKKK